MLPFPTLMLGSACGASKHDNLQHLPDARWVVQGCVLTIVHLQIPYTHKLVDPQNKPEDFKALYASIVANTDDSAKVPVIVGTRPSPSPGLYMSQCPLPLIHRV